MKATDLNNASSADKNFLNELASLQPPVGAMVKTLDSKFESFGDALFSWTNSDGLEERKEKFADGAMTLAFCTALDHPTIHVALEYLLLPSHYFESDAWFFKYLEEKGYTRLGRGRFMLLDEHYRPIAYVEMKSSTHQNLNFTYSGAEFVMEELYQLIKENVKVDESVEKKRTYSEVILERAPMGDKYLRAVVGKIENKRVALPQYYPYLDGGVEALIKDFVESDESVLILMGPPGTGKSSAVSAAVEALDLLPIYVKKADVTMHPDFLSFLFSYSDGYMEHIAGTAAKKRRDLFTETLFEEREIRLTKALQEQEEDETHRVPLMVVEDADLLLAPRSTGNTMMAQLLNETDGIGSNLTRKVIFTTNLSDVRDIDEALVRPGRCYGVVNMRLLTPEEAIAARAAAGLPEFETSPTKDISLAEALRKPRKRIVLSEIKTGLGFQG